jgi:oligopeptide transport system permease protein
MKAQDYVISSEKFTFHSMGDKIHDTKLETRPMSYFKDALHRFAKNKASIAAAVIIGILILFAIIAPMCTPYKVSDEDAKYRYVLPKK